MYIVRYINGTQWHIVDDHQQTVFIGTKQQAEDWLDFQENVQRQPAPATASPGRIRSALRLMVRSFQAGFSHFRGHRTDPPASLPVLQRHAPKH